MREILFKAKRKCDGFWIKGYYMNTMGMSSIIREGFNFNSEEIIPETLCQYIGLKDKNGNRIFEGDIVKAWSQGSCGKFEIKFREDGGGSPTWLLYPAWQNGEMWRISASREEDGEVYDRGLEIIGNIHDAPYSIKDYNEAKEKGLDLDKWDDYERYYELGEMEEAE